MPETIEPAVVDFTPPARRFTDAQLARLLEIASAVQCECPNHLSQIVSALVEFEEYSQGCLVNDDDDRDMHALLWRETSLARARMEAALEELVAFEGFTI